MIHDDTINRGDGGGGLTETLILDGKYSVMYNVISRNL